MSEGEDSRAAPPAEHRRHSIFLGRPRGLANCACSAAMLPQGLFSAAAVSARLVPGRATSAVFRGERQGAAFYSL